MCRLAIAVAIVLLGFVAVDAQPRPFTVSFETYDGYFVSNQFEPHARASFIVLRERAAFDRVFGVASVMFDHAHRLPAKLFQDHLILAAIHRGRADVTYHDVHVSRDGAAIKLSYRTSVHRTPNTDYACPLVVSVRRGDYSAVEFIENGSLMKSVSSQ